MIRLCLVLFSCCFFTTFANHQIDEIINAFHKMEQNLPPNLANDYFQIPKCLKIKNAKHTLLKLIELLESIEKKCQEQSNCNEEFLGRLEIASANLKLLSIHVEKCPNLHKIESCLKVTMDKMIRDCLAEVKVFLRRLKQVTCYQTR